MGRTNFKNRVIVFALIVLITYSSLYCVSAEENMQQITIRDLDEFLEFADNCTLDTYSIDKIVVLECDIDLKDTDFVGIPTFSGFFDGRNHTINGLNIDVIGSRYGLFGIIATGGEVKNINVEGSVLLSGSESTAGLIAGENYGRISNCRVSGYVNGYLQLGGIAGVNNEEGTISGCSSAAEVNGFVSIGGIAGANHGYIDNCINEGEINTIPQNTTMVSDFQKTYGVKAAESVGDVADTGGVTGVNEGTITNSINYGVIGYSHVGYNTGGIAGRHNGIIINCTNAGVVHGRKDIGGIVGQFEPHIKMEYGEDKQEEFEKAINSLSYSISNLGNITTQLYDDSEEYLTNIFSANQVIVDSFAQAAEAYNNGEELDYDELFTDLYKQFGIINNNTDELLNVAGENAEDLTSAISSISRRMNGVGAAFKGLVTVPAYEADDVSEQLIGSNTQGQILDSKNTGDIHGDKNVGGIAGCVALEVGNDPEADFYTNNQLWMDTSALFSAIISSCVNEAHVNAKNGNVGGITGNCDLGVIYYSVNTGDVAAQSEEYCGGIAGYSNSSIINCHVFCILTGNDSVGGIAGIANKIVDCSALVQIYSAGEKIGSIAGSLPQEFNNNIFARSELAAIDRINYDGKAYPVDYLEFKKKDDLPNIYSKVQVNFVVDGQTIESVHLDYGTALNGNQIPQLPEKDGYYGSWTKFDSTNITQNLVIEATYYPWITTIATSESPANLLCEGCFSPKASVDLWKMSDRYADIETADFVEAYDIEVSDKLKELDNSLVYRMKYEGSENMKLALVSNGKMNFIDYKVDGSYIVFNAGPNERIAVYKANQVKRNYMLLFLVLTVLVTLLVYFCIKEYIRRKNLNFTAGR